MPPESHNQKAQTAAAERRAILEVKELFKKEGMEIADNEIPTLKLHTPGKPPFPLMHVNTTWKFKEMITFRDRIVFHFNTDKKTAYLLDVGSHDIYE